MKKIALISTFCDTSKKLEVLDQNISIIKTYGLDVMTISPFYLPEEIVKKCDYFFLTKDNPILDWPVRAYSWWRSFFHEGKMYKFHRTFPDYGFAGLWQVKQLSEISLTLGYDQFFHLIYDTKIDETVIRGFKSEKKRSVFPSRRGDSTWPTGLHYMIFDKENLEKFSSEINIDTYISLPDGADAFSFVGHASIKHGFEVEKEPIEDWIFYHEGSDFSNCSNIPDLKFFIEKDPISMSSVRIIFYEIMEKIEIILEIENSKEQIEVENFKIVDLGFLPNEVPDNIWMTVRGEKYDIKKMIDDVKNSVMTIE